jgi:hypothetical protein
VKNNKPILTHKDVSIYEVFKHREALRYWYALLPNQGEGRGNFPDWSILPKGYTPAFGMRELTRTTWNGRIFDVRVLPKKYTVGLLVEDRSTHGRIVEREAHMEAIRRAIDDGFDLATGKGKKKSGRRFKRLISTLLGSKTGTNQTD